MITAQYAKKGKYIYYRCSKKNGKCHQPYLNSNVMIKRLKEELQKVSVSEYWAEIILSEIERQEKEGVKEQRSFYQNVRDQIKELDDKIDKLINSFLDGIIEKENYIRKKDELLKAKVGLQERAKELGKKGVAWVELARAWVELAKQAGKLALSDDYIEIKRLVKIIGSNRRVLDKEVLLDRVPPFDLVSKYPAFLGGRYKQVCIKEKDTVLSKEDVLSCRSLVDEIRTFYEQYPGGWHDPEGNL